MKLAIDSTKAVASGLLSTGCLTSGSYTIPKSSPSKWMFCILNDTMQKGNRYVAFHWSQVVHDHYDYKDAKFPNIFSTIFFLYISLSFPSRLLLFVYILTATMTRCWYYLPRFSLCYFQCSCDHKDILLCAVTLCVDISSASKSPKIYDHALSGIVTLWGKIGV